MDEIKEYGKNDMTNDDHLKFACSCSDADKEWCNTVRQWAIEYLKTDERKFLTAAIYKMNWAWKTSIDGIPNDMWSAISVEIGKEKDEEEASGLWTECDDILDGIAFTVRRLYNRFGDSRKYVEDEEDV